MSDIEGKVTRAGARERGQRTSFKIGCCNFCKGLFLKARWRWLIGIREWSEWDERHGRYRPTWEECLAIERCGRSQIQRKSFMTCN